jgi:hypothetical protein
MAPHLVADDLAEAIRKFFFIISEQQNCHVEGFDLPLYLLQLLLLSTQSGVQSLWVE